MFRLSQELVNELPYQIRSRIPKIYRRCIVLRNMSEIVRSIREQRQYRTRYGGGEFPMSSIFEAYFNGIIYEKEAATALLGHESTTYRSYRNAWGEFHLCADFDYKGMRTYVSLFYCPKIMEHMKFFMTSAKVLSLVGIILSFASLLSCIVVWIYTPISISFLISFILLIFGIKKNRPNFLLAAIIILSITIFINTILLIASIIIGITVPQNFIHNYRTIQSDKNHEKLYINARKETQIACFVLAFILFIAIIATTFAIFIISKARKYVITHLQRSPPETGGGYPLAFIQLPPPYTPNPPPMYYSSSNDDSISPPLYFEDEQNIAPPAYSDTISEDKKPRSFFRRKIFLICNSCDM